jgi:hypothetical protein
MGAVSQFGKIVRALNISICQAIFTVGAMVFMVPDLLARGGETGAPAGFGAFSGEHGGGNLSGHSRIRSGHGHSGSHRHPGGGHRHFGGTGHRYVWYEGRILGDGQRHYGGSYFGGYRGGFGYPRNFGYVYLPGYYVPNAYSYSYPSYSLHRPQYGLSVPYAGEYEHPQKYNRKGSVYRYNSASVRFPAVATGDSYSTNDLGWRLLAQNSAREALDVFAAQAGQYPKDGIPKVGYALSAAMQRDLNKAAWAMRGAFRIDPDSLQYLRIDASLRTHIDALLDEYHNQLNYAQGNRHFDVAFMIAALNYLIQEIDAARAAIVEVEKLGDSSPSAINLQRLVAKNKS